MGIYNFQERFVSRIEADPPDKTHTIRAKRKYPDKPGDPMYLYTALRTKRARRLRAGGRSEVPTCSAVQDIRIVRSRGKRAQIFIDGERLTVDEAEAFARRDGFTSFADMMQFWTGRLPFSGDVYHWTVKPKRGGLK